MSDQQLNVTIGLFGTCDGVPWRVPFIEEYQKRGIEFYNPEVPPGMWDPKMADVEAEHLATDDIILFPVLSGSWGWGSLGETGFSVRQALDLNLNRSVVVLVDREVSQAVKDRELEFLQGGAWEKVEKHLVLADMAPLAGIFPYLKEANVEVLKFVIENMVKANNRARRLVTSHLAQVKSDKVYVVDSLDEMLEISLLLHEDTLAIKQSQLTSVRRLSVIRRFNPANKFAK